MALVVILLGAAALVLGCSLHLVPPKHFALVTRFGRRTGETKQEGLRFLLFYPHVTGAILVSRDRHVHNISFPQVLSRDSAQIRFEINLAWAPSPEHASDFLDNGESTGADSTLDGVFKDRLRSWATATDWRDMLSASRLVSAYCIAGLSSAKIAPQTIEQLNCGSAMVPIPSIGIVLHRLNITSVLPSDKLAEAAQEDAIRKEKGRSGDRELSDTIRYTQRVMADLGFTRDEAVEFLQLERGKVSKSILELVARHIPS